MNDGGECDFDSQSEDPEASCVSDEQCVYYPADEGELGTWQIARTHCKRSDPPLRWVSSTEISMGQMSRSHDWASDPQQIQVDRIQAIDELRTQNRKLKEKVEALKRLLQESKGRTCLGPSTQQ
jgi:hypothetical protein